MLEAGDGVGGAWHWNTYPGIGVDIPSFSYQFSFEQRQRLVAGLRAGQRAEGLRRALRRRATACARGSGSTPTVDGATFDEEQHLWRLEIAGGRRRSRRASWSAPPASSPSRSRPTSRASTASPGPIDAHRRAGTTTQDLRGKRVAIIGTGASAVQVIPSIAPEVEQLTVFQRTPIWCLPKPDGQLGPRLQRRARAGPRRAARRPRPAARPSSSSTSRCRRTSTASSRSPGRPKRIGRKHLREQVHDPVVRDKLTPRYGLGCKRPSFSNDYLPTFNRANVELETDADRRRSRRPACARPTAPSTRSTS